MKIKITAKYIAYLWIFWKIRRPVSPLYFFPVILEGIPLTGCIEQAGGDHAKAL